jgi:hypothetical protein
MSVVKYIVTIRCKGEPGTNLFDYVQNVTVPGIESEGYDAEPVHFDVCIEDTPSGASSHNGI